jgi:hypothetical protein
MDDWKLPWTGGCRCGRLRFTIGAPPMLAGVCHCRGCQRMSASAFSTTLTVPAAGFRVSEGEPVIGGLHGDEAHHYHCGYCKSWVFTRPEQDLGFVNVRATPLDEAGWFAPFVETQTAEKLAWVTTPAQHSFERFPSFEEWAGLAEDYARRGARPPQGEPAP